MTKPLFKNRPNTCHTLPDGTELWISRSCAVMSIVAAKCDGEIYIALGKRGEGVPDEKGKFCLSCGYMDWDENAFDAARREVWEELGLDVSDEREWGYNTQPWWVQSEPTANRQNITMRFWFRANCLELPQLSAENSEENEVEELCWVPLKEAVEMDLAFNHQLVLKQFFKNEVSEQDETFLERARYDF